jgi:hypothetical protein
MRDAILEGVRPFDIRQLRLLEQGLSAPGSAAIVERLQAKGWVETVGGIHLITLTGRTLLERPPFNLD